MESTEAPSIVSFASRVFDLTVALLDSGRCPDCLGGECDVCQGFADLPDGVPCPACSGTGEAPHLDDCGLLAVHGQASALLVAARRGLVPDLGEYRRALVAVRGLARAPDTSGGDASRARLAVAGRIAADVLDEGRATDGG